MRRPEAPIRVAVAGDYEIVVAGVAAALKPFCDRVQVVQLDARHPRRVDVDIVLHDSYSQPQDEELGSWGSSTTPPKRVVFSWNTHPELVFHALADGADGYLAKSLTAAEIVDALERVQAGERVQALGDLTPSHPWPDAEESSLSQRELEVLTLITLGLTNQEIALRAFLSINSVKTFIRSAYRKIDVTRRAQAVAWGIDHGLGTTYSGTPNTQIRE